MRRPSRPSAWRARRTDGQTSAARLPSASTVEQPDGQSWRRFWLSAAVTALIVAPPALVAIASAGNSGSHPNPTAAPAATPVSVAVMSTATPTALPTISLTPTEPVEPAVSPTTLPATVPTATAAPATPRPTATPSRVSTPSVTPIATSAPSTGTPEPAISGVRVHIVTEGETLGAIATLYDTTVDALVELNQLTNADIIFSGQELLIPGP